MKGQQIKQDLLLNNFSEVFASRVDKVCCLSFSSVSAAGISGNLLSYQIRTASGLS